MECPFITTFQNVGPDADVGNTNEVKLKMATYIYIYIWLVGPDFDGLD